MTKYQVATFISGKFDMVGAREYDTYEQAEEHRRFKESFKDDKNYTYSVVEVAEPETPVTQYLVKTHAPNTKPFYISAKVVDEMPETIIGDNGIVYSRNVFDHNYYMPRPCRVLNYDIAEGTPQAEYTYYDEQGERHIIQLSELVDKYLNN